MVIDIPGLMQFFDAFVVSVLGTNFTKVHNILPVNRKWVLKPVIIPVLEQCHV